MFRNYLVIAVRNLLKYRMYSLINISGLAIGMASCILLLLLVQFHASFDAFHERSERIYRLVSRNSATETIGALTTHAGPLAPALIEILPEVEAAVRFCSFNPLLARGDRRFYQSVLFADASVFDVFTFPLLRGDPETALQEPYSLVITQEVAAKFFGDEDPLGQSLIWNGNSPYKITGILRQVPENSHISIEVLASWNTLPAAPEFARFDTENWDVTHYYTYLLLRPGYMPDGKVAAKVSDLYQLHADRVQSGEPLLQPLEDIYTNIEFLNVLGPMVSVETLYILALIGAFLLIISCVNFTSLSTARSVNRSREVGMRKVIGARRSQLVRQFLGESLIMAGIALVLALALAELLLPAFGAFAFETPLALDLFGDGQQVLGLVGIALFVGLVAGSYPAFALSAFQPVDVLKGATGGRGRGALFRRGLVVFQFAMAVFLIVSTGLLSEHMEYMKNKNLGFKKELISLIRIPNDDVRQKYPALKSEWMKDPRVVDVTRSYAPPYYLLMKGEFEVPNEEEDRRTDLLNTDYNFFDFYQIDLVAGRAFSPAHATDLTEACIVNETALRKFELGTAAEAIGREISWRMPQAANGSNERKARIVGVVEDAHLEPVYFEIKPLIVFMEPSWDQWIAIKVEAGDLSGVLRSLESAWNAVVPELPPDFSFLDQRIEQTHQGEKRVVQLFAVFAALAIIVTCLGLFGLASFTILQRNKEIGIRKVLGASATSVVLLLSGQFTRLVLIALLIAWPLSYVSMNQLFQFYPYRGDMGPEIFVFGGVLALFVAWLTVAYQALKTALADPVDALRYE